LISSTSGCNALTSFTCLLGKIFFSSSNMRRRPMYVYQ
jgi:hypothetical protein